MAGSLRGMTLQAAFGWWGAARIFPVNSFHTNIKREINKNDTFLFYTMHVTGTEVC